MFTLLQSGLRTDDEGNCFSTGWSNHCDYLAGRSNRLNGNITLAPMAAEGWELRHRNLCGSRPNQSVWTGNLTEAMLLEAKNPELAKALKAEALQG